jgi:hypothetical protein
MFFQRALLDTLCAGTQQDSLKFLNKDGKISWFGCACVNTSALVLYGVYILSAGLLQ